MRALFSSFTAKGWLVILTLFAALVSCSEIEPDGQVVVHRNGYTYRGNLKNGRFEGLGQLSLADSVVYVGQWHNGKREGKGIFTDSIGRFIESMWHADTIATAVIHDSISVYSGQVDKSVRPHGHGTLVCQDGSLYDGEWNGGKRSGFGFSLLPGKHLRIGEWASDRYLGERLEYTANRIYGIDISRFQHDVGSKHYPIYWGKLRITSLGIISRKRVNGSVDYPVSFCYIKSTEGTSVRNRYYVTDYHSARKQGIACGAYHFFSTISSGEAQANFFLKNSKFSKGDFPPVLDVEPSDEQIEKMGGTVAMFRQVRTWLRLVQAQTGVKPVLYVSQSFVNRYLASAPDLKRDYNVWIARYGEYKPDVKLVIWQLCPDGRVRGITPQVDINVFNGYSDEFATFKETQTFK